MPVLPAKMLTESMVAGIAWTLGLGVIGVMALLTRRRYLRDTTLSAPWIWSLGSLLLLAVVEVLLAYRAAGSPPSGASHLRYMAAATTFCPMVALLGAKRPQNRGWQFVVASLPVVLLLPALQAFLYHPEAHLELHAAWSWFLLSLVVIGLLNTLPTRYWLLSLLFAGGQCALLADHLPMFASLTTAAYPRTGLALIVAAAVGWSATFPPQCRVRPSVDRVWLDFRDFYGAFWAVQLLERFNTSAGALDWEARLNWHGLEMNDPAVSPESLSPEVRAAMHKSLAALLRRFVSPEWLAVRLEGD